MYENIRIIMKYQFEERAHLQSETPISINEIT